MLIKLLKTILEFIFPIKCEICGQRTENKELICRQCDPQKNSSLCLNYLKFNSKNASDRIFSCLKCQEPTTNIFFNSALCPICQIYPLPLRHLRSIWYYKEEIEELIKKYKYHSAMALADYFAKIACKEIVSQQLFSPGFPEVIIPIPSTKKILKKREFNHTYLIAKKIACHFEIPCYPLILKSNKERLAQAKLAPEKRIKNMKNAFIMKSTILQGKRILLFDDVITTAASVSSSAESLKTGNCAQIDVLTLARSPNFSKNRVKANIILDR